MISTKLQRIMIILAMIHNFSCKTNELSAWSQDPKLTATDKSVLEYIAKKDVHSLINFFDEDVIFDSREEITFKKSKDVTNFLSGRNHFYKALFDTNYMMQNHYINSYMFSFQEALLKANKFESGENEGHPELHFLLFELQKGRYVIRFNCKLTQDCRINLFNFTTSDGSPINEPMNQLEYEVLDALKRGDHNKLYSLFPVGVFFGEYINVNEPYFMKNEDGKAFLDRKGEHYQILFDPNSRNSFVNAFKIPYEIQITEYQKYAKDASQRSVKIINSEYRFFEITFRCPLRKSNECKIESFRMEIHD